MLHSPCPPHLHTALWLHTALYPSIGTKTLEQRSTKSVKHKRSGPRKYQGILRYRTDPRSRAEDCSYGRSWQYLLPWSSKGVPRSLPVDLACRSGRCEERRQAVTAIRVNVLITGEIMIFFCFQNLLTCRTKQKLLCACQLNCVSASYFSARSCDASSAWAEDCQ